jgi:hypothetical protein
MSSAEDMLYNIQRVEGGDNRTTTPQPVKHPPVTWQDLSLPDIAMCCCQHPVPVNQSPATEVLSLGALQRHYVFNGVGCWGIPTHDPALRPHLA